MRVKQVTKRALQYLLGKEISKLRVDTLDDADVVSFDVFDTLVLRSCSSPEIVFDIVERRYNATHSKKPICGFRADRVAAESVARGMMDGAEPTIFDIYAMLSDEYRHIASDLLRLELDTEVNICRANPEAKALYETAVDKRKRIVIASDMYLDSNTISRILVKCGYEGTVPVVLTGDGGF